MGQVNNIGNRFILKFRSNSFGFVEIFSRLINWGCLPLVSLLIAPDIFGQIVLLYSWILILTVLGGFGQQRAILMYGSRDSSAFYTASFLTIITVLVVFFVAINIFGTNALLLPVILMNVLVNNLVSLARAKENFLAFTIFRIGTSSFRLIFVVVFLVIEPSLKSYIAAEITSVLLILLFGIVKSSFNIKSIFFQISLKTVSFYFSFGFPLFLQAGMTQISQIGDRFIISYLLGDSALASYFFTSVFCSSVAFIFAFNAQKYEVKIYRSYCFNAAKINAKHFLSKSLYHAFIMYFVSLIIYYFASRLSGYYSFDFALMTSLYLFFSTSIFFTAITYLFSYVELNKYIFYISFFSASFFLTCTYLLIEYLGVYAIPVAGLSINLFAAFLFLLICKGKIVVSDKD